MIAGWYCLFSSRGRNEKQIYYFQAPWINQTLIITQKGILSEHLWCTSAKATSVLESRKQRMRWSKLNSMKIAPPTLSKVVLLK